MRQRYAVERAVSDAASWNAEIKARAATAEEAYAKAQKSKEAVLKSLVENGAKASDVAFSNPQVFPVLKMEKGERTNIIEGYTCSMRLGYATSDVVLASRLAEKAAELISRGVDISSGQPEFYYTKLEELKLALIGKASANARERALKLTQSGGSKLGGIVSASQGIFQITRPLSNDTSDYGLYDTSSVEKDVRCVVTVSFEVEK